MDRDPPDRDLQTETPCTETPTPRQRPTGQTPLDRDPWTETPLYRDPLDRDPWDRDPPGQRPRPPCGQTDTCENLTFANFKNCSEISPFHCSSTSFFSKRTAAHGNRRSNSLQLFIRFIREIVFT